jgi:hypothetical protein
MRMPGRVLQIWPLHVVPGASRTSAALANRRRRLDGDHWLVFH